MRTAITGGSSFGPSSVSNFEDYNTTITAIPSTTELAVSDAYWTSTPADTGKAYYYKFFNSGKTAFSGAESGSATSSRRVRAAKIVYF